MKRMILPSKEVNGLFYKTLLFLKIDTKNFSIERNKLALLDLCPSVTNSKVPARIYINIVSALPKSHIIRYVI